VTELGVVFPGDPRAPATWSGTPSGVVRGLEEWGATVSAISVELPANMEWVVRSTLALPYVPRAAADSWRGRVRVARAVARAAPPLNRVYSQVGKIRLSRKPRLEGWIQIGTGYILSGLGRYVTFEDLTVPQALALHYPEFEALSSRARRKRLLTQRIAYEAAVGCCFTTRWAADSAIDSYGIDPAKVHVVGVGRNHAIRVQGDRDWTTPRFLFVGVDWERKNGPGLLRAFEKLRVERPDATLDVVGRHPTIDQEGVAGHGLLRLGVPEERARVEGLFSRATCFVMPSHYEPSALAYVEAGAAGLPAIGTSVGGAAELIGDGGRIVDPWDIDGLTAAMRDLCEADVARSLGEAGRERSELYTWRLVAERLVRALSPNHVSPDGLAPFLEAPPSP
jgi:glycosyltransferase involved in cell wall biosynthesis